MNIDQQKTLEESKSTKQMLKSRLREFKKGQENVNSLLKQNENTEQENQ